MVANRVAYTRGSAVRAEHFIPITTQDRPVPSGNEVAVSDNTRAWGFDGALFGSIS